jgi:hypothetical protein
MSSSRKVGRPTGVPVDAGQWSAAARRRLGYLPAPAFYQDRVFACRSCQCEAVFSAEQQKHEFEVKKAHYLRQRVLCPPCFARRSELQDFNDHFAAMWDSREEGSRTDIPLMLGWLDVLTELPQYGVRRDTARIRMLERLAAEAA